MAYWVDSPQNDMMLVKPSQTTNYDAMILYCSDTSVVTAAVEVYENYDKDTIMERTLVSPLPFTSLENPAFTGLDVSAPGVYFYRHREPTIFGCDSMITLILIVNDEHHYSDTLCPLKEDHYFAPFDTVFQAGTQSGVYEHHGSKVVAGVTVDTVAYYHLTILPAYQTFDTVEWCLYEPSESWTYARDSRVLLTAGDQGVTVTSASEAVEVEEVAANTDYLLKMQTVNGCDSLVYLHLDVRRVKRDTVYVDVLVTQVVSGRLSAACHAFTGIGAPGTYTASDTLASSEGCDSIRTVVLVVEPLHVETLCDSALTAGNDWQDNVAGYAWRGNPLPVETGASGYYEFPGQKRINGVLVDTTSYLRLIVNHAYRRYDTVRFCMYEETYTAPYSQNTEVTISVVGEELTVTAPVADDALEVLPVPASTADFLLKMRTVNGCDSLLFLHVEAKRVPRDTLHREVYMHHVENETVVVDGYTFRPVTGAGIYWHRDTLRAANGCDSIVEVELTVIPCASGYSIVCPPDVYDTLAYGDCVMTIYPERIGTPILHYEMEWPFIISNDIPEEYLFAQGDNVVTWTMTDSMCGNSVSCEQHVVIAFPKCPDAVDCEGNVYHGVRIGCDCWTQRNLESTKYSDCEDIPVTYAYMSSQHPDTTENVSIFGRLYPYESAVRDSADNGYGHVQGICPAGWYLPTPAKYEELNVYGSDALKSPHYWIDGGGHNATGFTALPAGYYNGQRGRYEGMMAVAYFWSTEGVTTSTVQSSNVVQYSCDSVLHCRMLSGLGYSVRCIKEKEE
jgi:uncharacterized protein (TIGR02145 family)